MIVYFSVYVYMGFSGGSDGKESACNAGEPGLIPGSGRSPEEGNGNPLQYFCRGNPWTEEAGRLQSMGSQTLSDFTFTFHILIYLTNIL